MDYNCNTCKKKYSSYQSLWIHNKKFHKQIVSKSFQKVSADNPNVSIDILNTTKNNTKCRYCNKIFSCSQNRWKHENRVCINKTNIIEENKKLKEENAVLKNNQSIINKNSHNTTNNNNTNNGTINNITINAFGKEKLYDLPIKELKKFIRDDDDYLYNIIKYINFNEKYPENHSFCNTSLEGKYMSLLNTKTNTIEKVNKNDFLEKVYENATDKIEGIILHLEHDKDFREQFQEKYIMHFKNKYDRVCELFIRSNIHKKRYKTNINQLSYNKKELVRNTWSNLKDVKEDDEDMYSDPSESTLLTPNDSDSSDDMNQLDILV